MLSQKKSKKLLQQERYLTVARVLSRSLGGKSEKNFRTYAKIVLEIIFKIDNIM